MALVKALETGEATIDRTFFDWRGGRDPGADLYPGDAFRALAASLVGRELMPEHSYWSDPEPCSMHIDEVETIWAAIAERDDWSPFDAKIEGIRRMGQAMRELGPPPA
jgi:hypothetical protein